MCIGVLFKGRRILADASYDQLWHPYQATGDGDFIGLSWFIGEYKGYKWIDHWGGDTGFLSAFRLFPTWQRPLLS